MALKAFRLSVLLWILVLAACGGDAAQPAAREKAPVTPGRAAAAATVATAGTVATTAAPSAAAPLTTPASTSMAVPSPTSVSPGRPALLPTSTATSKPAPTSTSTASVAPCTDNPLRCAAAPPAGVAAQFSASSVQFQDKNAPVHISPAQGPIGTLFDITFQTLQAGQPFYLYRKVGCGQVNRCEWEFVAALQAQQRDAAGSVTYRLPTNRGDPPGHYLAWDRSTPPGILGFFPAGSFVLEDGATAQSTPTPGIRGLPTRAAPLAPGKLAPSVPSGALTPSSGLVALRARIVSPPAGTTTVTKELAFQVEAYDEKVGTKDGAGIDRVEMFVIDSKNRIVHERTDTIAAYCRVRRRRAQVHRLRLRRAQELLVG